MKRRRNWKPRVPGRRWSYTCMVCMKPFEFRAPTVPICSDDCFLMLAVNVKLPEAAKSM